MEKEGTEKRDRKKEKQRNVKKESCLESTSGKKCYCRTKGALWLTGLKKHGIAIT
jgi:hypothetical protein